MNRKRAIIIGVVLWFAALLIGVVIFSVIGVDSDSDVAFMVPGTIGIIVLAVFGTMFYFRDPNVEVSSKEGFFLGLTFFVVGTVLDLVLAVPSALAVGAFSDLLTYYFDITFFVGVIALILTPVVIGSIESRRRMKSEKKKS